ncbi:MAG: hypothetical protein N2Z71_04300 [Caloramator sp.]|nr:hypothetical protein [Caloramator sp.]
MQILNILKSLSEKVEKLKLEEKKKGKINKVLNNLIEEYSNIDIDANNEVYKALIKKGKDVLKSQSILDIEGYIRYCEAALYDFKGELKPLSYLFRAFLITSILFMLLAPQYFGPILPLIFILPIFLGIKGLKKRSATGLTLALSVLPMGLLTSVASIKNSILALGQGQKFYTELSQFYKISLSTAKGLFIVFFILSIVLAFTSIYTFVIGVRHKRMFV